MGRMMKGILEASLCSMACCLLAACNVWEDAADVSGSDDAQPVEVRFRIALGSEAATRLTATDEAGTGWENYIAMEEGDFRFLLFNTANTYISQLTILSIEPVDDSAYPQEYEVTGSMEQPVSDFKLMVLANWGNTNYPALTTTTTMADVCGKTYAYTLPFVPSQTLRIPMYGVRTYTNQTFVPNLSKDLGTIDLLRAMAKVEVVNAIQGATMTGVKLNHYHTTGMCAPSGMYDQTTYSTEVHLALDSPSEASPIAFSSTAAGSCLIYVPEYDNTSSDTTPATIALTLNERAYTLYFKDYESGLPFNLLRNHHYKFTIVGFSERDYTLQYIVDDYTDKNIEIPPFN